MEQKYVFKTTTRIQEPTDVKRLKRGGAGVWEVRSSRYPQLWDKVVFDIETRQIRCGCKACKSGNGILCKHMFRVMAVET